jgi:superfamily II DNA helicase RecQ
VARLWAAVYRGHLCLWYGGIDHPAVRLVIHMGQPRWMIDFAQEIGRLGRDGSSGRFVVLLPGQWKGQREAFAGADEDAMHLFQDQPRCRVAEMAKFLDGDPGVLPG